MDINSAEIERIRRKRGRKSKKELAILKKYEKEHNIVKEVKVPKKRGRKPKGGKIVKENDKSIASNSIIKENVILHLKCKSDDLFQSNNLLTSIEYQPSIQSVQPYNNNDTDMNLLSGFNGTVYEKNGTNTTNCDDDTCDKDCNRESIKLSINKTNTRETNKRNSSNQSLDDKEIWKKIKELNNRLHNNKIPNKDSSCFWCSCNFTTPPVYIPKSFINGTYEVYGSFCIPECAVGFLFREQLDNTTRWERYAMLNSIYSSIFKYKKNIKPAPEPYYILDKFYGTLSIDEYRQLMRKDKLLMVVDKPLTRILPELYDDNNEFNINTSSLSQKSTSTYKLSRVKKKISKHDVNFFNT